MDVNSKMDKYNKLTLDILEAFGYSTREPEFIDDMRRFVYRISEDQVCYAKSEADMEQEECWYHESYSYNGNQWAWEYKNFILILVRHDNDHYGHLMLFDKNSCIGDL